MAKGRSHSLIALSLYVLILYVVIGITNSFADHIFVWAEQIKESKSSQPEAAQPASKSATIPAPSPAVPVPALPAAAPSAEFTINIPKINLAEKIIAGVDPFNKSAYLPVIANNVAQASNSKLPGENSLIYLFAHSGNRSRDGRSVRPIFSALAELSVHDIINLGYRGKSFNYRITDIELYSSKDPTVLLSKPTEETLVLQTCWPPEATSKILIITAKPISQLVASSNSL